MDANRYFIMVSDHNEYESFTSEEAYKTFLMNYSKNNRDSKSNFVYGNFKTLHSEKKSKLISYTVYKRVTKSTNLLSLDNFLTEQVEDEQNLRLRFKSDIGESKGKLYIGYMESGQARTLPIFYKKDRDFVDYESLKRIILKNILEETFLASLWTNKKLNNNEYRKKIDFCLEKIQVEYGKYMMKQVYDTNGIKSAVSEFVKSFCTSKGKLNQRYVRTLGSIVKNIIDGNVKVEESIDNEIKGFNVPSKTKTKKKEVDENPLTLF